MQEAHQPLKDRLFQKVKEIPFIRLMFPVGPVVFGNCRYQDIDLVAKIIAVKFGGIIILSAMIDQILLAEVFGFLF